MPDSTTPASDRTVVVHRHGALTYISLAFNALILLLILLGIASHHHAKSRVGLQGGPDHRGSADRDDGRSDRVFPGHHGWGMHEQGCWAGRCSGEERDFDRGGMDQDRGSGGFGMEQHPGWGDSSFGGGRSGMGMDRSRMMMPPSPGQMTDRLMLMLDERLSLTDDESAKIRPMVQADISQLQKDMTAQKQAHQKMIDDAKTRIRSVLNTDQQREFDDMTAGMGTPAPAAPPAPPAK